MLRRCVPRVPQRRYHGHAHIANQIEADLRRLLLRIRDGGHPDPMLRDPRAVAGEVWNLMDRATEHRRASQLLRKVARDEPIRPEDYNGAIIELIHSGEVARLEDPQIYRKLRRALQVK